MGEKLNLEPLNSLHKRLVLKQVLLYPPRSQTLRSNYTNIQLAASPDAPVWFPDASYIRPGIDNPTQKNYVIKDALIAFPDPIAKTFFSPPNSPERTAATSASNEKALAGLWASLGEDWTGFLTSHNVYGPPKFTSIVAKVRCIDLFDPMSIKHSDILKLPSYE